MRRLILGWCIVSLLNMFRRRCSIRVVWIGKPIIQHGNNMGDFGQSPRFAPQTLRILLSREFQTFYNFQRAWETVLDGPGETR